MTFQYDQPVVLLDQLVKDPTRLRRGRVSAVTTRIIRVIWQDGGSDYYKADEAEKTIIPFERVLSAVESDRQQKEAAEQELRLDRQRRFDTIMSKLTPDEYNFVVGFIRETRPSTTR